MENLIQETISGFLGKINSPFRKIKIEFVNEDKGKVYKVNIESEEPSLLIGRHGETLWALQHLLKLLIWQNNPVQEDFNLYLDIDSYRKKQEESVIIMAERKVETVRKFKKEQALPAMSPYFRRIVHLHLANDKFSDIYTESEGDQHYRFIIIKPKA